MWEYLAPGRSCSPSSCEEEEGGNVVAGFRSGLSSSGRRHNSSFNPSLPSEDEGESDDERDEDYRSETTGPQFGPTSGTRRSLRLKTVSSTMMSVKPSSFNPMDEGKTRTPTRASMRREKRPAGDDPMAGSSMKKNKKNHVVIEVEDGTADDEQRGEKRASGAGAGKEKKRSVKRVWEEEDEIKLLRYLRKYMQKKRGNLDDMNAFVEFSRKKMGKFVERQVKDKVCKLKNKYRINANVERKRGKATFKTHHQQEIYLMSKDIWGEMEKSVKKGDNKEKQKKKAESHRKSDGRFRRKSSVVKKLEFHHGKANPLQNEGESSGRKPETTALSASEDEMHVGTSNKCSEAVGGIVSWREELGCRFFPTSRLIEKGLKLAEKMKVKGFEEKRRNLEDKMLDVHLTILELACKTTQFALEGFRAAKSGVMNR